MTTTDARKYDNHIPVFKLKPQKYYRNTCIINHVGYIDTTKDTLLDTIIDIKTTDYEIKRFGVNVEYVQTLYNYDIIATIMRNNIKGDMLLRGEYFPVYSLSIGYIKNTLSGFLFDIFVGFVPDQQSVKILKDPKNITNSTITGTYKLKIFCDKQMTDNYSSFIDSLDDAIVENPTIANHISSMTEDVGIKYLRTKIDESKDFFKNLQTGSKDYEYTNHDNTVKLLRDLYKSHKIDLLIKFALIQSEKARSKKYNAIESYEIPKNVIKLNNIKNNLDNLSSILHN